MRSKALGSNVFELSHLMESCAASISANDLLRKIDAVPPWAEKRDEIARAQGLEAVPASGGNSRFRLAPDLVTQIAGLVALFDDRDGVVGRAP